MSAAIPAPAPPVCVVTGGSNGIGWAVVQSFLKEGYVVYNLDVALPKHPQAANPPQLYFLPTNVGNPQELKADLQKAFEEHKRLDCLVNNAAVYECEENHNILWKESTASDQINKILQTNLGGVIHGTQAAYRLMTKETNNSNTKTIVNISSMGALRPTPQRAVYGCTKAAILHFTRTADADLSKDNIRVFCVCPGIIDTQMGRLGGERNRQAVANLKDGKRTPPELVAEAVLGLVQRRWDTCSYVQVDNHEITPVFS